LITGLCDITSDSKHFIHEWAVSLGKIELNKAIKPDNIYYDLNKSDIRFDAAKELEKLVETKKSNRTVNIELSLHTDSRGKDHYNKW